jgi:predicted 2-oxoglutarate/Fe(II)-dependent dioxygenase YbiX
MNINILKDFISKDGAKFLSNYFTNIDPEIRYNIGFHWSTEDSSKLNIDQPIVNASIHKAIIDIQNLMENHYKVNLKFKRCIVQTVYEGGDIGRHFDNMAAEKEEGYPQNIYPAILYLNDDYTGGELVFVNLNTSFRFDPGTLVFFPGTEEYEHEVNTILTGERTAAVFFFNNI